MTEHHDAVRNVLDVASVFATLGSLLNVISPIFGLIGAIVGVMRIAEMATGKPFSVLIGRNKDDAK
jgi:hypothetical protein